MKDYDHVTNLFCVTLTSKIFYSEILNKYNDNLPIKVLLTQVVYDFTLNMEYLVNYIDRPRFYGAKVTFVVHWADGSASEEDLANLIPGSIRLVEEYLYDYGVYMSDFLREKILNYF